MGLGLTTNNRQQGEEMIHWLQSLSENGFDVFIVVYLAILHLIYHYLMRWYIRTEIKKLKEDR